MVNNIKSNLINFRWEGTNLELHSEKFLFVPTTGEMLISDVHIGKAEFFQLHGIPLTNNEDTSNLNNIYKLIKRFRPEKLIILGDLFHSKYSLNQNLIKKVEKLFEFIDNIELIEGNHDRGCFVKNISYLKEKKSINLIYSHEPINTKNKKILNICGHYHPKVILKNNHDKLSFKCFALDPINNNLFLPSFGDLTGGYPCKKFFKKWPIISENQILEVN
tara:strand:- start:131 stop:787 length:657 start_codon:yes stop_codon:yes gene_type:complete